MNIKTKVINQTGVITLDGYLNASESVKFKNEFSNIKYKSNIVDFILDLTNLEMIDSTGLGAMISCLKLAVDAGGDMKLYGLKEKPKMILEITRTISIFTLLNQLPNMEDSFHQMEVIH